MPVCGYEYFDEYDKVDPNNRFSVTPQKVTFNGLQRDEDAYLSSDKGAANFNGDFTHLLTLKVSAFNTNSRAYVWALANEVNDAGDLYLNNKAFLGLRIRDNGGLNIALHECDGSGGSVLAEDSISSNTVYYLKIVRNEAVGDFGTLYCYIYSDAARSNLVKTLTLALTIKNDFRYIYGPQSYNDSTEAPIYGYVENLCLCDTESSSSSSSSSQSSSWSSSSMSSSSSSWSSESVSSSSSSFSSSSSSESSSSSSLSSSSQSVSESSSSSSFSFSSSSSCSSCESSSSSSSQSCSSSSRSSSSESSSSSSESFSSSSSSSMSGSESSSCSSSSSWSSSSFSSCSSSSSSMSSSSRSSSSESRSSSSSSWSSESSSSRSSSRSRSSQYSSASGLSSSCSSSSYSNYNPRLLDQHNDDLANFAGGMNYTCFGFSSGYKRIGQTFKVSREDPLVEWHTKLMGFFYDSGEGEPTIYPGTFPNRLRAQIYEDDGEGGLGNLIGTSINRITGDSINFVPQSEVQPVAADFFDVIFYFNDDYDLYPDTTYWMVIEAMGDFDNRFGYLALIDDTPGFYADGQLYIEESGDGSYWNTPKDGAASSYFIQYGHWSPGISSRRDQYRTEENDTFETFQEIEPTADFGADSDEVPEKIAVNFMPNNRCPLDKVKVKLKKGYPDNPMM